MFNNTKGSLKKNIEIVNFFPIGGGGLTPKFSFFLSKDVFILKIGLKVGFFDTRMAYFKF